jgi:hypothetical protein
MNVPPYAIDVRVVEPGAKGFRIWVPMFLLWPLLLVLGVIALLVAVCADVLLVVVGQRYHHYSAFLLRSFEALTETRGLKVYAKDEGTTVDVTVR